MAVGFPAVDEYAVALTQFICLSLVGKFSLTRQNNEAKERSVSFIFPVEAATLSSITALTVSK